MRRRVVRSVFPDDSEDRRSFIITVKIIFGLLGSEDGGVTFL